VAQWNLNHSSIPSELERRNESPEFIHGEYINIPKDERMEGRKEGTE